MVCTSTTREDLATQVGHAASAPAAAAGPGDSLWLVGRFGVLCVVRAEQRAMAAGPRKCCCALVAASCERVGQVRSSRMYALLLVLMVTSTARQSLKHPMQFGMVCDFSSSLFSAATTCSPCSTAAVHTSQPSEVASDPL